MKNNKHMLENLSKITKETDCIFDRKYHYNYFLRYLIKVIEGRNYGEGKWLITYSGIEEN